MVTLPEFISIVEEELLKWPNQEVICFQLLTNPLYLLKHFFKGNSFNYTYHLLWQKTEWSKSSPDTWNPCWNGLLFALVGGKKKLTCAVLVLGSANVFLKKYNIQYISFLFISFWLCSANYRCNVNMWRIQVVLSKYHTLSAFTKLAIVPITPVIGKILPNKFLG